MTRAIIISVVIIALIVCAFAWLASLHAAALDERAAAEIDAIRARAEGQPVVVVGPGPVRVVERERVVVQRVAPTAKPIGSAEIETGGETHGAPQIECPDATVVQCPDPLTGCETHITGWRTELGNVLATGTQTRWWQWPGEDRQESTVDLTPTNTKVTADPRLLVPTSSPRWLAGALVGLGSDGSPRYGAVAARKLGGYRGVDLHAVAVGLVGGGDVVVSAGLAVGW